MAAGVAILQGHLDLVYQSNGYVWSVSLLTWVPMTQPTGGGGGGTVDQGAAGVDPWLVTGTVIVDATTGLSTSALQTTGNASLSSIDSKTPALGQQLAAASSPVVLTAAQLATLTPPPAITGFATETTLGTRLSETDFDTKIGSLTETAPGTDTGSSGLNGRLQRIAQRLTTLITALGSPFQAGGLIGNTDFGATQSGTWTVQPGNTPNTVAWKVDGSSVTQPVSGVISTKTILTATAPASASVGVASGQIVASNASRTGLYFKNRSNNIVSFAFNATAVLDAGITLEPGQDWQMNEYTFDNRAVNAIAGAAASLVAIQEFQ